MNLRPAWMVMESLFSQLQRWKCTNKQFYSLYAHMSSQFVKTLGQRFSVVSRTSCVKDFEGTIEPLPINRSFVKVLVV